MFSFIPLEYYSLVFYWSVFLLSLGVSIKYASSSTNSLLLQDHGNFYTMILAIILCFYIGYRPLNWIFQDMVSYARIFQLYKVDEISINWKDEWGMPIVTSCFKILGWPLTHFFMFIATGYIVFQVISVKKLLWENTPLAFLFIITSFSFWGYGTNGIRNGLACAIAMLSITELLRDQKIYSLFWGILALGFHHSTALPIFMVIVAKYVIKRPKYAIYFWLFSIILSLISGNTFINFFASLGFDERMSSYVNLDNRIYGFAHLGFRWDFLLYSAVPVALTWYATQNKRINDSTFNTLSSTYILSNAFWIIVARAAFSNRFAYLSWFIYPLVIAYAIIRLPIWQEQDKKAGIALFIHSAFTFMMFLIGKLF